MSALALVVPLYNEETRLAESGRALVHFVASYGLRSELVLVDDGSTDGTIAVAEELRQTAEGCAVRVLARPHMGKGGALRAGLQSACGDIVAFCDVDLATPLSELARIVKVAGAGPTLAVGSRDVVSTTVVRRESEVREFLGRMYNRVLRVTLVPGIFDTQCGAKAAALPVWEEILPFCREEGFAFDVEALAVARRLGIAVWEVGIEWSHDPRTRVRPMRDGVAMLAAVPRIVRRVQAVPSLVGGPSARPIVWPADRLPPVTTATAAR